MNAAAEYVSLVPKTIQGRCCVMQYLLVKSHADRAE